MAVRSWVERAVDVIAAFLLMAVAFSGAYAVYVNGDMYMAPAASLMLALALALMVRAFVDDVPRWLIDGLGAAALALYLVYAAAVFSVWNRPFAGTDEILFAYYADYLLTHGINPYTASMAPIIERYHSLATPLLTGGFGDRYSYPALSFLIFMPFYLAGLKNFAAVQLLFLGLTMLILYRDTPPRWRALAVLAILLAPVQFQYAAGGVMDIVWMPLLILSMRSMERGRHSVAGLFLGLADSVKQTPWIAILYLAIYYIRNRGRLGWRPAAEFFVWWFAAFAAVNAPFALWPPSSFSAWLSGVMYPAAAPAVSQGFALALLNMTTSTLPHGLITALTVAWAAATLAMYWSISDRPDAVWLAYVMPALVYFVTWRSLANYFIAFVPAAYYGVLMMAKMRGEVK
jgi:uncharacterized membrane protein